jgi:hypothetical protein
MHRRDNNKQFGWLIKIICRLLVPGLQVAVKCRNSKGEYESTAVGPLDKSGAFSVPLAADLVADDGELRRECFAQLHSASSEPCPGQEPSKIVAASTDHGGSDKTFVALGGEVHRSSPECASAFLCYPFLHHKHHHVGTHKPVVIPHEPDHGHGDGHDGHSLPPVTKPPVDMPEHKPPVPVPEHSAPPSTPAYTPPSTPVPVPDQKPPSTPTPIYHPPAQRNAVADP